MVPIAVCKNMITQPTDGSPHNSVSITIGSTGTSGVLTSFFDNTNTGNITQHRRDEYPHSLCQTVQFLPAARRSKQAKRLSLLSLTRCRPNIIRWWHPVSAADPAPVKMLTTWNLWMEGLCPGNMRRCVLLGTSGLFMSPVLPNKHRKCSDYRSSSSRGLDL
jgi:hypothetical protein